MQKQKEYSPSKNNISLVLMYNKSYESITKLKEKYGKERIEICKVDLLDSDQLDERLSEIVKNAMIDCFVHSVSLPFNNKLAMDMNWNEIQPHIDIQSRSFFQIVNQPFNTIL